MALLHSIRKLNDFYQTIYNKQYTINNGHKSCLKKQPSFYWITFVIWQIHTCIQDYSFLNFYFSIPSLSTLSSLTFCYPGSWLLVLFCDPCSVSEDIWDHWIGAIHWSLKDIYEIYNWSKVFPSLCMYQHLVVSALICRVPQVSPLSVSEYWQVHTCTGLMLTSQLL